MDFTQMPLRKESLENQLVFQKKVTEANRVDADITAFLVAGISAWLEAVVARGP